MQERKDSETFFKNFDPFADLKRKKNGFDLEKEIAAAKGVEKVEGATSSQKGRNFPRTSRREGANGPRIRAKFRESLLKKVADPEQERWERTFFFFSIPLSSLLFLSSMCGLRGPW